MTISVRHSGRSWGGPGPIEADCPCPKAPCGLVPNDYPDPCGQHDGSESIRSSHRADACPGATNSAGQPGDLTEETA